MTDSQEPKLERRLGPIVLILYGLGTVLGAGIYVLIGEVAGRTGGFAPLSFLVASALSALTAFGFAELAGRFPKSAGEAVYVQEGFGFAPLSLIVGLLVALAGVVSSAAIAQGFTGYLATFVDVPNIVAVLGLVIFLTALACWGIAESVMAAAVLTLIEGGALILIIVLGVPDAASQLGTPIAPADGVVTPFVILSGAVLAFYAFIGFEDMVNVAEEVHDARRTLPKAIFWVVVISTVIYVSISFVAVRVVPPAELAASNAPMTLLFERLTNLPPQVMSLIAMLAVINGALIQIIMAARVLYGLAQQGSMPAFLGRVHPSTRTPVIGTMLIGAVVLVSALLLPLVTLAEITSALILVIFTIVNLALIAVKRQGPVPEGLFQVPMFVPILGAVAAGGFAVLAFLEVLKF